MRDNLNNRIHFRRKGKRYDPRKKKVVSTLVLVGSILLLALVVVYFLLPNILPKIGVAYKPPFISTPVPTAVVTPAPTENPYKNLDFSELQQEIYIAQTQYKWFSDPYFFGNKLIFTAGELISGDVSMSSIFEYNIETEEAKRLTIAAENNHILYPVFNDTYLVYLDAKATGGGKIICHRLSDGYKNPITVKEVYTGQPTLYLSQNYLVWTERTGTYMDKLFVCDLTSFETVTVQMFEKNSYYGTSKPDIVGNTLVWADADSEQAGGAILSQLCTMNITTGKVTAVKPGTYIHDPKTNGKGIFAWLDGNHGKDTKLYLFNSETDAITVLAEGVVDFFMDTDYLAYQKNGRVYIYLFGDSEERELSSKNNTAQLFSTENGCVAWIDTTSKERDSVKFAVISDILSEKKNG